MSVKRLFAAVVTILVALAIGTGNFLATLDYYMQEAEYILRLAFGG